MIICGLSYTNITNFIKPIESGPQESANIIQDETNEAAHVARNQKINVKIIIARI
ncbi:12036_t:CDS:2, partial [Funneliformis geosporum]